MLSLKEDDFAFARIPFQKHALNKKAKRCVNFHMCIMSIIVLLGKHADSMLENILD